MFLMYYKYSTYIWVSYLIWCRLDFVSIVDNRVLLVKDKMTKESKKTTGERKTEIKAMEFSGFRRRWRLLGWVVRSQLAEREQKQNGEKEDVRRKERGQENVGCRYGQGDGGRERQSEVENGRERGTKGPAKGVTKRAGAEGDRGRTRRGRRRARGRKRSMLTP